MDRQLVYPNAVPLETDLLNTNRYAMEGIAWALQGYLGTSPIVDGLLCTPTTPTPNLVINIGTGTLYSVQSLDASAFSSLALDTTHQIVKQALLRDSVSFSITPPATVGQSQNYLVQVAYSEADANATLLSYFNSSNPAVAYSGTANAGTSNFTARQCRAVVSIKSVAAATTGSQVTPTPDAGNQPLWVITVAQDQTQITGGNIVQHPSAPIILAKLPAIPVGVQANSWSYAGAGGTASAITIAPSPLPSAYVAGMGFKVKLASAIAGATTLNVMGSGGVLLGAKAITMIGGGAFANLDYAAGDILDLVYDGTQFQCLSPVDQLIIDTAVTLNVPSQFADINAALAYLSRRRISTTGYATIQLAAGIYTYTSTIGLRHPDGARVSLAGATLLAAIPTIGTMTVTGGAAGARASDLTAQLAQMRTVFATELRFTGVTGFYITGGGVNTISNLLVTGNGAGSADGIVATTSLTIMTNCAFYSFASRGIVSNSTDISCTGCFVGGNQYGFVADSGKIDLIGCIATSNTQDGMQSSRGGTLLGGINAVHSRGNGGSGFSAINGGSYYLFTGSTANLNASHGFSVLNGGQAQILTGSALNNTGTGFSSYAGSAIQADNSVSSNNTNGYVSSDHSFISTINASGTGNTNFGYYCSGGSEISRTGSTATGATPYSPAFGVIGNNNSLIY